jgi:hypothetical protein
VLDLFFFAIYKLKYMRLFLLNSLLIAVPVFVLDSAAMKPAPSVASVTVEGVVVNHSNSQPVSNIYLYIVKGEEEALTDDKGRFSITTWQSLPVTLTVDHIKYKRTTLVVKEPGKKQLIRLEVK